MNIVPRNNFDLLQKFIPYKIVKYKDDKYYVNINVFVNNANIFGYSLYFLIDEKFYSSYNGNEIYEFLSNLDLDSENLFETLISGTESLIPGENYFLTGNLDNTEIAMSSNINDYEDISSIKIKDIDNINYFIYKNSTFENIFSEDELDNLNSTFMKLIQQYSEKYNNITDTIDFVYKNVIDYYANGQYDDATILMNTIFNGVLSTTTTTSTCGCSTQSTCASSIASGSAGINTGTEVIPVDIASCIDKYKAAMYQWLIQMLSDTDFYCNWMFTNIEEDDNINIPDEELLDKLIELLTEFLNAGYDLTNLKGCTSACGCGHTKKYFSNNKTGDCTDILSNVNVDNCSNYTIIENYIKVLNWVKNNQIDENKNKIYIYGKQFAEIFPLLSF